MGVIGTFEQIVRSQQSMVYSLAYRYLGDPAAAEELAQDVFLELHRKLDTIESPAHLAGWLRKVTCHRAIDESRRRMRRPETPLEDAPEPAAQATPGDPMLTASIRRCVAMLPEKARLAVILKYQEDLEPAEIAGILGMPVNTVKSHLQRSLRFLREKLARAGVAS